MNCKFINFSEPGSFEKYNLSKILKMLIVHDLGEVYTGDIITCIKSEEDEKRESDGVRSLVTLDTLPHFNTFGYIDKLASELRSMTVSVVICVNTLILRTNLTVME